MRVLAIIALAMWLAGCEGDRIKQSQTAPVIVATVPCLVIWALSTLVGRPRV